MIRPIQEIHTKVAIIRVDKTLEDIVAKDGVLLWNLEGRWGLVPAPIVANAFSNWRDYTKMQGISPGTPVREFWIGWPSALAVPPEVAKALLASSDVLPSRSPQSPGPPKLPQ